MRCQACSRECRCPYRETRDKVMVGFTKDELQDMVMAAYISPQVLRRLDAAMKLLP